MNLLKVFFQYQKIIKEKGNKMKNKDNFSYTLGITLTFELLLKKSSAAVCVYLHSKFSEANSYNKLIKLCNDKEIEIIHSDKIFNILSQKENCYVIGKFNRFTSSIAPAENHIVLVNPSNAGNLGTMIRSAVGFGINNIAIVSPAVDIFDTKCVRASMGSLFSVSFEYFPSFEEYEQKFSKHTMYPFMLKGKNNLSKTDFVFPYSLIFGNEATGLPDDFLKYSNTVIIKHSNDIDSLNLTIAMSIACYEATKNHFTD